MGGFLVEARGGVRLRRPRQGWRDWPDFDTAARAVVALAEEEMAKGV